MGVRVRIDSSNGIFPPTSPVAEISPEEVLEHNFFGNHPSFKGVAGEDAPGTDVVQGHLDQGFGLLFRDRQHAEQHLASPIAPAPLGCITKLREDGSAKHRVIMDLRRNRVNDAAAVPERQVLPTLHHHAFDIASLASLVDAPSQLRTLVLDFTDAFMGVPLHPREHPFNCCVLDRNIVRTRPACYKNEPWKGTTVVWRVLGFGGKPNPLVYSRAASFGARTAQALLRTSSSSPGLRGGAPGLLQLYVDDPALVLAGSEEQCAVSVDVVALWWLVLGLPLAWAKGSYAAGPHRWIGAIFEARPDTDSQLVVVVSVPPDFADALWEDLELFTRSKAVSRKDAERLLGRAGRLSYIVPCARPFVTSLWGAFLGTESAAKRGKRGAPPGKVPTTRFKEAVRWLSVLLRPPF